MHCESCGTRLPDEARFCWNCGRPAKKRLLKPGLSAIKICKISGTSIDKLFSGRYLRYEARVDGQVIDRTPDIKLGCDTHPVDEEEAFNALLARLLAQGWEPVSSNVGGQINTLHKRLSPGP